MKCYATIAVLALSSASALGQDPVGQDQVQFERDVLPFLQKKCFSCHAAPENGGKKKEPKGELRLDGKDWILAGGEGEDAIVAKDLEDSGIYRRVALPADDPDFMPSKGDPLTDAERATLRRWIESGADFGDWVGDDGSRPAVADVPIVIPESQRRLEALGEGLAPIAPATLTRTAGDYAQIQPALAGSPLLRVSFLASQDRVDDRRFGELAKLAPRITQLDLSRTKISDKSLAVVARMTNLTRLDLNRTAVTDRGLAQLRKSAHLHTLNLFGTSITDDGLEQLAGIRSLRKLYLWQTKVTDVGVTELRQQLPDLEVAMAPAWPKAEAPRNDGQQRRRRR